MRRSLYRIPIREDFTRAVLAGGSHLLRRLLRSSGRTRYRYTNNATLGSMTVGAGSTSLGPTCASSRYAIRLRTALHKPGQKPSKVAGSQLRMREYRVGSAGLCTAVNHARGHELPWRILLERKRLRTAAPTRIGSHCSGALVFLGSRNSVGPAQSQSDC